MRFWTYVVRSALPTDAQLQVLSGQLKGILADPAFMAAETDVEGAALYGEHKRRFPPPAFADTLDKFERWASEALSRFP